MRTNTYIRLEMLYKKYKGYVETREILEEGFSNRQIAVLVKEGYLENYMAKNLYMLDAHLESRFETEPADGSGSRQIYLVPEGFWPLSEYDTYDDRYFWQAP